MPGVSIPIDSASSAYLAVKKWPGCMSSEPGQVVVFIFFNAIVIPNCLTSKWMTFLDSWDKTGKDRHVLGWNFLFENLTLFHLSLTWPWNQFKTELKINATIEVCVPNDPQNMRHNNTQAILSNDSIGGVEPCSHLYNQKMFLPVMCADGSWRRISLVYSSLEYQLMMLDVVWRRVPTCTVRRYSVPISWKRRLKAAQMVLLPHLMPKNLNKAQKCSKVHASEWPIHGTLP